MYRFVGMLGLVMSIFFVGCGIAIMIFRPETSFIKDAPAWYHFMIGSLLVGYGIFRFWRSYMAIKNNKRY
ncbi:MAG: hypothetical protein AAFY71_03150 [Bacteroidota bacterium]